MVRLWSGEVGRAKGLVLHVGGATDQVDGRVMRTQSTWNLKSALSFWSFCLDVMDFFRRNKEIKDEIQKGR